MYILKQIWKKVSRLRTLQLAIYTILLITVSSYVIHLLEPDTFQTVGDGFWWVMTTLTTVGYGDLSPQSFAGRMFAVFVLYIVGIGLMGVIIGKVVDLFSQYRKKKEEGHLAYKGEKHVLLIGWSEKKSKKMIQEIHSVDAEAEIVIVDQKEKSPYFHHKVHYVQGDPIDWHTLDQANALHSKAVILIDSDDVGESLLADGKTLLIATSIENYSKHHQEEIYTIAVVREENHIHIFSTQVDEFILSDESVSQLTAKAAVNKGSSKLFRELLNRKQGFNFYRIPIDPRWKTYRDAYMQLREKGANLIADRDNFGIVYQLDEPIPREAELYAICEEEVYQRIRGPKST